MRKGGGKGKGNAFEGAVGRRLSLWLSGGTDKTQLIPSRLSGGWTAGLSGGAPWRHAGDLAPNGPLGDEFRQHFAVECKHHAVVDLWHIWTQQPGDNLLGWWAKIIDESLLLSPPPCPLVVFRPNRRPTMLAAPLKVLDLPFDAEFPRYGIGLVRFDRLLDELYPQGPRDWYSEVHRWQKLPYPARAL